MTDSAGAEYGALLHRTAVVTGAGRGIGRAIAEHLAAAECKVILVARSRDEVDEVARAITSNGGQATAIVADLGRADEASHLISQLLDGEPIDILINNAATVWPLGPTIHSEAAELIDSLTLNFVVPLLLSAGLAPAMADNRWGRIVNVSSAVVSHPGSMKGAAAYVGSKAALEAHTLNFAAELAGTGVTVNVFRPGMVDTSMQKWIRDQGPKVVGDSLHAQFSRSFAEGKLAAPDRPAAALVSRIRSDVTGQVWDVSDSA